VLGVADDLAVTVPRSPAEPTAAEARKRAELRVTGCDDRGVVASSSCEESCSAAAAAPNTPSDGSVFNVGSGAAQRKRIRPAPTPIRGACSASSSAGDSYAATGETAAEHGCWGERVPC